MSHPPETQTVGRLSAALGVAAGLAVLLTLGDPGITSDEPLDVRHGRTYVATLRARGRHFFDRDVVAAVFRDNAEHPPLGRWLLGIASTLGEPFEAVLGGPDPYSVHAGRLAPALAFAILVVLVARVAGRRYGPAAGAVAGSALVLMPRMFAHAHLAALDTFVALTWTAALFAAGRALSARRPSAAMAAAGVVWGLALLTKIHAWFLPPVVLALALARGRSARTVPALGAWAASGLVTFALGWPWLWYDTPARLRAYLGTGVERIPIRVEYFGRVYLDRDVPWHYPWVYFAVTVPIGLHALGLLGLARAWRLRREDAFPLLLSGTIAAFLFLFSTKVPVYDGERLFLLVFPLWAVLIGLGFDAAWRWAGGRNWVRLAMAAAVAGQGYGVVALHPFGLSYYNALVGGLPGAERLGLELTYWGDAVDPRLLDALAGRAGPGAVAAMVPTLHHIQGPASTTPALARRGIALRDESAAPRAGWLVVYRRTAYWRPELQPLLARGRRVAVRSRQGVWLSAVWDLSNPPPPPGTPPAVP